MHNIRQSTKKHRKILIVVVVLLALGLVGSFAVWNSSNSYANKDVNEMTTAEKIDMYEKYLEENEPAEGTEITYDIATNLANVYMELYSLYNTAYSESQETDATAAQTYQEQALVAAAKAAEYYQIQLDTAGDTLNEYARAGVMGSRAAALAYAGNIDEAKALYQEALALSPENYEVAANYLYFLNANESLEAAQAFVESYVQSVEITYNSAYNIANLYMELRTICYNAYSNTTNEDTELGKTYYDQSVAASLKAAEYYQIQLDNAPDTVDDSVKAGIIGNKAAALAFAQDNDTARTLYEEALAMDEDNYQVAVNYLYFLNTNDGIEAAEEYANSYMALVGEESDYYAAMQEQLDYLLWLEDLYQSLEQTQEESAAEENNASGDTEDNADGATN